MADSDYALCNLALLKIGDTQNLIGALTDPSNEAMALALIYPQKRDELLRLFKWPWAQRRGYPAQLGGDAWAAPTDYAEGDYVSFAPDQTTVVNAPESVSTFVYLALAAITGNASNPAPDEDPTNWRQISRAAYAYVFEVPGDVLQIHGLYHGDRNAREDQQIPYELAYEPTPGPGTILLTDAALPWEAALGDSASPVAIELEYTAQVTDTKQFPPDFTDALAWLIATELALALRKDADVAKKCADAAAGAVSRARVAALRGIRHDPPPTPSFIAARRGRSGGR